MKRDPQYSAMRCGVIEQAERLFIHVETRHVFFACGQSSSDKKLLLSTLVLLLLLENGSFFLVVPMLTCVQYTKTGPNVISDVNGAPNTEADMFDLPTMRVLAPIPHV